MALPPAEDIPFHNAKAQNPPHTVENTYTTKLSAIAILKLTPFSPFCLHLDAQEVAQLDLRNVVADKLVVLEVCTVHVGGARLLSNVGLLINQPTVQKRNKGNVNLPSGCP